MRNEELQFCYLFLKLNVFVLMICMKHVYSTQLFPAC
jgi:hypothetical protein